MHILAFELDNEGYVIYFPHALDAKNFKSVQFSEFIYCTQSHSTSVSFYIYFT